MTILDDIKQLKTDARSLRKFGFVVGGVLAALGLLFWLRHKPAFPYLLVPGAALMISGLVFPRGLRAIYIGWMSIAFVLGFIVSNVILTLLYCFVVTPMGLAARCVGRDFLTLKSDRQATTFWIRREHVSRSKADYERQF